MSKTLSDFLAANGLKTAAAKPTTPVAAPVAKTTAKVAAAPVKKAEDQTASAGSAAQPTTEPADGHKLPNKVTEAPAQDTGKTAAQKWLAERGIEVADAKVAEAMVAGAVKTAEANKMAHLEKRAEEERLRGELFYEGMVRKSCAYKLASGEMSIEEAAAVAPTCGTTIQALVKHAEQLQAAMSTPALTGSLLGSAAKVDVSAVTQVADKNDNTSTTRDIEAIEGTRKGTSGIDEKVLRFVDVWTLPGNPGLSHGQAVDQGKSN